MNRFIESLESRSLFSASPVAHSMLATASATGIVQPLAASKKMVGTWSGIVNVTGVHSRPVTIVIKSQTGTGHLTGTLTTSLDPSIIVNFSGKIGSNRRVHISLAGTHSGGAINGIGSGKLSANGKKISISMNFVQNGFSIPGSLNLAKGSVPLPPPPGGFGGGDDGGGERD